MAFMTVETLASKPFIQKALENPSQIYSVLSFFFGADLPEKDVSRMRQGQDLIQTMQPLWYAGGSEYDKLCQPFAETIRKAGLRKLDWNDSVDGKMAQLILTDQLSRNVFRGTPEAFAFEDVSLELARSLGKECRKEEKALCLSGEFYPPYLGFVVTALMHSEDLADQTETIKVLEHCESTFPALKEGWKIQMGMALEHKDVVDRFGRYPHRNKLKNRQSTSAEQAWLDDIDNLPGWAKSQG